MADRRWLNHTLDVAVVGLGLALAGWVTANLLLATAGSLLALLALLEWAWGRRCLDAVSCTRTLQHRRTSFGERVTVEFEVVNDKLLPLAWLHVRDEVPPELPLEGAARTSVAGLNEVHLVFGALPFQRVRRRLTVVCSERGAHRFGPMVVRSGSPLGTSERELEPSSVETLLVYPKVVPLSRVPIVSKVPIGERRVRRSTSLDPSRVVGVRPYANGDPMRDIEWRATARSEDLVVRVREPAASPIVALYVDLRPPGIPDHAIADDVSELLVSAAASLISEYLTLGVPIGLYTSGTVRGMPVAVPPARDRGALASMLELLAHVRPVGGTTIGEMLTRTHHRMDVSVLVLAADFPRPTIAALTNARRRTSVGVVWADCPGSSAPPAHLDGLWRLRYDRAWREWPMYDLVEQ